MMAGDRRSVQVRLPPQPASVARARQLVRASLEDAGRNDLAETAELLVSEVVTNALVHAGTPVDIAVSVADDGLRVEVGDGSPHLPSRRQYGPNAGTGRGLLMLERMVDDWGVVRGRAGKTVWFQLDSARVDGAASAPTPFGPPAPGDEVTQVRLLEVPLLLHAAWQQHAEALLREHLLAQLDTDSEVDPIQEHAEAGDAMAILAAHIPRPGVGDDSDQVLASAVEPSVSDPGVLVPVPRASVRHFETLAAALDAAVAQADAGTFLTPPPQPELRTLRRWLCGEVAGQGRGQDPRPWSAMTVDSPAQRNPPDWDPTPVLTSKRALVAADDNGRIVAVSGKTADLLGYPEPGALAGHRLVTIVPERFRQAHLAGFTIYLLTGRGPLIGDTIVVPVLCADGSERTFELVIDPVSAADGRAVFVAALTPTEG